MLASSSRGEQKKTGKQGSDLLVPLFHRAEGVFRVGTQQARHTAQDLLSSRSSSLLNSKHQHKTRTHKHTHAQKTNNSSRVLVAAMSKRDASELECAGQSHHHICSLGTLEVVHILSYKSLPDKVKCFECLIQDIARQLHECKIGMTDVRVSHPVAGEVNFIVTFLSKREYDKFVAPDGPEACINSRMSALCDGGATRFRSHGTLMPAVHSLKSLLAKIKPMVVGNSNAHDVPAIKKQLALWFPRKEEYEKYIFWDETNPKKYTRNVIYKNEHMDVLLVRTS